MCGDGVERKNTSSGLAVVCARIILAEASRKSAPEISDDISRVNTRRDGRLSEKAGQAGVNEKSLSDICRICATLKSSRSNLTTSRQHCQLCSFK